LGTSATRLHQRKLQGPAGSSFGRASVFPFFTAEGEVRWVLFVPTEPVGMRLFRWAPGRFHTPWFKALRIAEPNAAKPMVEPSDASVLQDLWHYDPWWLLAADSFRGHAAAGLLRATNCAEVIATPSGGAVQLVTYERDLSRVEKVLFGSGDNAVWKPWTTELLPATYPPRPRHASGRGRRRWRLDPLWARSTK